MYKKIKNASFMNWLWFLVYIMPFIVLFGYILLYKEQTFNGDMYVQSNMLNNYLLILKKFIGGEVGYYSPISIMYQKILGFLVYGRNEVISESTQFFRFVCGYLSYITYVSIIHLAFDLLMLLPNICHKFMEKVGGERD